VAENFRTAHHEIIADLGDFATDLPRIVWHLENPVPSSIIPTFYLAKHIYPAVKVILVGEGGDELFAGYRRFKAFCAAAAIHPERLRSWAYWQGWHTWNPAEKRQLYTDSFRQQVLDGVGGRPQFEQVFAGAVGSALNRALLFEQAHELSEIQLWRIDRLTSAFSLEARVPFLDLRVVELANTIPARYKLKGFQEKYILRQAMASLLPQAILRRPKRGLGAPFRAWFSHGLREMATDYLATHRIHDRDYFQSQTIQRLFQPRSGRFAARRYGTRLFVLLLFEIWCQQFLDHHPARPRLDNSVLPLGAS
jgi:asparagine synthase (glutamine-hydrolysing)